MVSVLAQPRLRVSKANSFRKMISEQRKRVRKLAMINSSLKANSLWLQEAQRINTRPESRACSIKQSSSGLNLYALFCLSVTYVHAYWLKDVTSTYQWIQSNILQCTVYTLKRLRWMSKELLPSGCWRSRFSRIALCGVPGIIMLLLVNHIFQAQRVSTSSTASGVTAIGL